METTLKTPRPATSKASFPIYDLDYSVYNRFVSVKDTVGNFSPEIHLTPAETLYHHEYETHEMRVRTYTIENMEDEDDDEEDALESEDLEDDFEEDDFEEDVDEIEEDIDDLDPEEDDEEDF